MEEKSVKDLSDRKQDHIELAFEANMANQGPDPRFFYEPVLAPHPSSGTDLQVSFLNKKLGAPVWVSSMTGGTEMALEINQRLANSCAKFRLGMGLGSCRPLLKNLDRLGDFDMREIIGPDLPFFANLGIAQVEELLAQNRAGSIQHLITTLRADGLIVHINPLQEWLQPEGDTIHKPPLETIHELLSVISYPVIIKEVGQGMGPASIRALLQLPIAALELAAHGGTNFSKLELLRSGGEDREIYAPITRIGHGPEEMIAWINQMHDEMPEEIKCREIIVSGGIKNFLDGYYWTQKLKIPSLYGQASQFLKYARESQVALDDFISNQIKGLQLAHAYLKVR